MRRIGHNPQTSGTLSKCNNCGKRAILHGHADQENYKCNVQSVYDTENSTIGTETDKSESIMFRNERISTIKEQKNT